MNPDFFFEKKLWKKGFKVIAGVDEVGRGSFAGPVVAAACAFAPISNYQFLIINERGEKIIINDSKKLTARQREISGKWIKENTVTWGIGEVSAGLINRVGMAKATKMAFRRAIADASLKLEAEGKKQIDFLLIDAFYIPHVAGLRRKNQLAIINGDQKSFSIAAASIIAKVYRDKLMQKISKNPEFQVYKWGKNKGYGTKEHQEAILKYGITRYHRRKFIRTFMQNLKVKAKSEKPTANL